MAKKELEFFDPKIDGQWRRPVGYPEGISELIITECPETKVFTRLLKFEPGVASTNTPSHDCWEEVYIIYGLSLIHISCQIDPGSFGGSGGYRRI